MRVFIAIDINEQIRSSLRDLQSRLQSSVDIDKGAVKWVRPESIHLTLKFLGEIRDQQVVEICDIVKNVAERHKGFELAIESVGCFGGKIARVLWVGTGQGSEALCTLQEDLEQQLASAGWPKETRAYSGHLTLCRVKSSDAGRKLAMVGEDYKDFKIGSILADSITVYQSQLRPAGPIYTALGNYKMVEM